MIKHIVSHLQIQITSAFQKLQAGAEGLAKPERFNTDQQKSRSCMHVHEICILTTESVAV